MSIDAISYKIITEELDRLLKGGRINKIVQPERDEIQLTVYADRNNYKLTLCSNPNVCRMHLTSVSYQSPSSAPSFCMLLRKHLSNALITGVSGIPFERVADFSLEGTNELGYPYTRHLIIELTGKNSNIVLTDENYVIFDTIKKVSLDTEKERQFFPGTKYSFFAPRDKVAPDDTKGITALVLNSENPFFALENGVLGISKDTLNEILFGMDRTRPSDVNLAKETAERFSSFMESLRSPAPNVLEVGGEITDVFPVIYRSKRGQPKLFDTLNQAFDYYFTEKNVRQRFKEKSRHISTVVKNAKARTEKKIAVQTEALLSSDDSKKLSDQGNLVLANIYRIKKGQKFVTVENFYEDNKPVTITLDETKTPQANAEAFFKKALKLKKTAEYTRGLLEENKETLKYLISVQESLKYSATFSDLEEIYTELTEAGLIRGNQRGDNLKSTVKKHKNATLPAPLRYEIGGFTVYAGKNNVQNDFVTNKLAKPDDIWLHTKDIHSSHAVIVTEGKDVPDEVIEKAAEIVAFYSEARNSGKTPVDYTKKRFVKKPPKSPVGFVNYTNQTTAVVFPEEHKELLSDKQ